MVAQPQLLGLASDEHELELHVSVPAGELRVVVQPQPVFESQHDRLPVAHDGLQALCELVAPVEDDALTADVEQTRHVAAVDPHELLDCSLRRLDGRPLDAINCQHLPRPPVDAAGGAVGAMLLPLSHGVLPPHVARP
eukprot:CAMPEP_0196737988 /NCGR_PEP_ID=MMETSP1091-20130531/15545_1 /TAXON_ID=302021 /ORGANISM="Rhodomonas sp., Strain CCMP768" /LENGTH=137 /DNA_ID=CAMNT_0042081913 /DNA_START=142 /DNA_END=552 /DNA_ORIENTATION=-